MGLRCVAKRTAIDGTLWPRRGGPWLDVTGESRTFKKRPRTNPLEHLTDGSITTRRSARSRVDARRLVLAVPHGNMG